MENYKRKVFLQKLGLLTLASTLLPGFTFGRSSLVPLVAEPLDDRIIDLHCHPSLKMYLWNQHLWKKHFPGPGANEVQMQDDLHQLGFGRLKGLVVAHYLIEAATKQQWNLLKKLFPWINRLLHGLADKIEHEDASNFTQINLMIDIMEAQVHRANERQDRLKIEIARSFSEFDAIIAKPGHLAIAHAIEGAHALGRNFAISKERKLSFAAHPEKQQLMIPAEKIADPAFYYLRNLEALHSRGVCMLTIAHIFKNDLAHPVEGISDDEKKTLGMSWHYETEKHNCDLSPIGIAVAKRMLELGMVIDLTHSTPAARQNVFEITRKVNTERVKQFDIIPDPQRPGATLRRFKQKRPLAFTHVGLQAVFEHYDRQPELQNYKFYDISDAEISAICECDGVIGIIPENFWLTGADRKSKKPGILPGDYRFGIKFIVETMVEINKRTRDKDFSNIAIGTDFDGFADAPKDLYVPGQLGTLIEAIRGIKDITPEQVVAITSGNARRLLERGWGDPMGPVDIGTIARVGTCSEP